MSRRQLPDGNTKAITAVVIVIVVLLIAWSIGRFVPGVDNAVLAVVSARSPNAGQFLRDQHWSPSFLIAVLVATFAIWIGFKKVLKAGGVFLWQGLSNRIHRWRLPMPVPADCSPLSGIQRKLFPEEDGQGRPPELLGRGEDLDWLRKQVQASQTSSTPPVRVLLLWGPQGIGKTHLLFRFATGLTKGEYRECGRWQAWSLDRDFDPRTLGASLADTPTFLLWDDVSLEDDATYARLRALLRECATRRKPLVLAISGWQPRKASALTLDQALVDAEHPVGPLDPAAAERLYAGAAGLPETERGHPLLLRLLSLQVSPGDGAESPTDLWGNCQQWASGFALRLQHDHALSSTACRALAVASSSEACSWSQAQATFGLSDADHHALRKTGRLRTRHGAIWLEPLRPDLLGWAYALHALETIPPQDAKRWATQAWRSGFFDTERFLRHAQSHALQAHVWVRALHAPQFEDEVAALARLQAATNAVYHYGEIGQSETLAAELAVAQAIAVRFPAHAEIQLTRAKAATNAVNYYGQAGQWQALAAELAAVQAIADCFPASGAIQLERAKVAANAVGGYGGAGRWEAMTEVLAVVQAIAVRFYEDVGVQLVRLKAATNAMARYGEAGQLEAVAAELVVANEIAARFPQDVGIQLARAEAATNAVGSYGGVGQWEGMATELVVAQEIAMRFPQHVEIQLIRAKVATNSVARYGEAGQWEAMAAELTVAQAIAMRFPAHVEIQLARAWTALNAMLDYSYAGLWEAMAAEQAVMQSITTSFPLDGEIQLVRVMAATNAVIRYGRERRWEAMAAELAEAQMIATRFPKHVAIQLERGKAVGNAVAHYGDAGQLEAMAAELMVAQEIAACFSQHEGIQLMRAKAATNAVRCYGDVGRWEAMAAELVVVQAIATRFPGKIEIQQRFAQCLLARIRYAEAAGWPVDAAAIALMEQLDRYPQLQQMPPFDQLVRDMAQLTVDDQGGWHRRLS